MGVRSLCNYFSQQQTFQNNFSKEVSKQKAAQAAWYYDTVFQSIRLTLHPISVKKLLRAPPSDGGLDHYNIYARHFAALRAVTGFLKYFPTIHPISLCSTIKE